MNPEKDREGFRRRVLGDYKRSFFLHANEGTEAPNEAMKREFRTLLGPHLPEDRAAPILDVGCGLGYLLQYLKEAGYTRAAGIDLSPQQAEHCRGVGLENVEEAEAVDYLSRHKGEFDRVLAFDLLEHLTRAEGLDFLDATRAALGPGGKVIMRVPNMSNLFASKSRYVDITHETGYTEHSVRQMLMLAGFGSVEILPWEMPHRFLGRVRIWLNGLCHRLLYRLAGAQASKVISKSMLVVGAESGEEVRQ